MPGERSVQFLSRDEVLANHRRLIARVAGADGVRAPGLLASGIEVDFIVGDMRIAIEAKSGERITRDRLKGLRALAEDHPGVERRIVVCREKRARRTEDGIEILPASTFVRRLWDGDLR